MSRSASRPSLNVVALLAIAASVPVPSFATGEQFVPVVSGTAHQALFAVAFDGSRGLAVGAGGQILESQDLGKTWNAARSATDKALLGVAIDPARTIVVGQSGLILVRTGEGGWTTAPSGTEERLFGVGMNAAGVAVAVGAFGKILRSADGGATWASIAPAWSEGFTEQGLEPHLYAVEVAPDGVITCVGEFGLILRSADSGQTWTVLHKGDASLFGLDLRADGVGYAVGQGGTILRTTDGGATWAEANSGSHANLLGVQSAADGHVYVTAMRDMLVSDDGLAWRRIDAGDFGSAWYSAVFAADAGSTALVVGHSGNIVRIGR